MTDKEKIAEAREFVKAKDVLYSPDKCRQIARDLLDIIEKHVPSSQI